MLALLCFSFPLLLCSVVFQFQFNEIQISVSKEKKKKKALVTSALVSVYVNDQKLELHFDWTKSLEYSTNSLR